MSEHVGGRTMLWDQESGVLLSGRLGFLSDGQSRSEIVIGSADGDEEERLVFAQGNNWIPVYRLIQHLRALHDGIDMPAIGEGSPA